MSHQPFETWILDDNGSMNPADRRALQAHLDTCKQCRQLEMRWQAVHQELRARPAAPAAGFTQRWSASLSERRAREQRRQAWRIFGALMGSALFFLMVLAGYMAVTNSPTDWLEAAVRTADSSQTFIVMTIYVVQTWLTSTPLALNLALWVYLTVIVCLLSMVFAVVLWQTKAVGVLNQ